MTTNQSPRRDRLTLCLIFVLVGLAALEARNTIAVLTTPVPQRSFPFGYVSQGIWSAAAFFRPLDATSTDIAPTLHAARRTLVRDPELYADFKLDGASFIYPPTAAIELLPIGWFFEQFGQPAATRLMDLVGRLCAVATVVAAAWCCRGAVPSRGQWALVILALIAFYPLRWMLVCIQYQSLLTVLLVLGIVAYAHSRNVLSGVLVGLAACVKPHLAILVLFGSIRREWRFVGGAVATAAVLMLLSVAQLGTSPWWTYFGEIIPQTSVGYGHWPNQSINGIAHRYVGHTQFALVTAPAGVKLATLLATVVFGLLAVLPRGAWRRAGPGARADRACMLLRGLDLGLAMLAITLASPIAWEHHYAWTVMLYAICLSAAGPASVSRWSAVALAISYVLLGSFWQPVTAASSGPASLVNSAGFIGAVLLLCGGWSLHRRLQRQAARPRMDS